MDSKTRNLNIVRILKPVRLFTPLLVGLLLISAGKPIALLRHDAQHARAGTATMITNCSQLQNMNLSGSYQLAKDITDCGQNFTPIGSTSSPFVGTLDGNGFTIQNLTVGSSAEYVGLFGYVGSGAAITNLRLVNVSITSSCNLRVCAIGGVAGVTAGSLMTTFVQGSISVTGTYKSTNFSIGGVVGENDGQILLTQSNVAITVNGNFGTFDVGGLVGYNGSNIQYSSALGQVQAFNSVGGCVDEPAAGLVGTNGGSISYSYATGNVDGEVGNCPTDSEVGGLVGEDIGSTTIFQSFATGSVKSSGAAGGLVGWAEGKSIAQSYATGRVEAGQLGAGGLIGLLGGEAVTQAYATGTVINHSGPAGGVAGDVQNFPVLSSLYWDLDTSSINNRSQGCGNVANCSGVTGRSTGQMQDGLLDKEVGFDATIWEPMLFEGVQQAYYPQLWALSFPISSFPLANQTPYNARIITVFDHELETSPGSGIAALYKGSCDKIVLAFSGKSGLQKYGQNPVGTCDEAGYENYNHDAFIIPDANYTGELGTLCPPNPKYNNCFLNYEGHPGFDYGARYVPVLATVSGMVFYPWKAVGTADLDKYLDAHNTYCLFHTMAEVPDVAPAYRIYYLHLETHPAVMGQVPCVGPKGEKVKGTNGETVSFTPKKDCTYKHPNGQPFTPNSLPLAEGTHVEAGCEVAISGSAGAVGPHLHFEIQQIVPAGANINLSALGNLHCWEEGNDYHNRTGSYCLPADPYGWTGEIVDPTNCPSNDPNHWTGDIWQCLTGIPERRFWTQ